jgi:hypothetical protein
MANVYATKSGNWSDTTVWNTLALPTVNDDVFANNFTVTVDIDTRVLSIRTTAAAPAVAGGSFRMNNAISLSANVIAGGSTCLSFLSTTPNFCNVIGNCTGSTTTGFIYALDNNRSGTVNLYGNASGGTQNPSYGIGNLGIGIINVYGIISGSSGAVGRGCINNSSGTVNVIGRVLGTGLGSQGQHGVVNNSTGAVNVTGSVVGGFGNNVWGIDNFATGTVTVVGTVSGGSGSTAYGIINNSSGNITTTGSVSGGTGATAVGIINNSSGIVNIIGNVGGGSVLNNSTGFTFITGNCFGGASTNSHAVQNASVGAVTVIGNAFGGSGQTAYGVYNNSLGRFIVSGNAVAGTGTTAYGAFNNSTGFMYVQGTAIGNGWGLGSSGIGGAAPGIFGSQTGTTIVQSLCCGARGQWPTAGNVFILPQQNSTMTFETSAFQDVTLFTSFSANITPPVSSVRLGTKYNLNDYTGTCVIPSVSSVLQGVAVDNSIGIAALQPQTVWSVQTSAIDTNSLGGRLKESATVQSFGQLLTAFNM